MLPLESVIAFATFAVPSLRKVYDALDCGRPASIVGQVLFGFLCCILLHVKVAVELGFTKVIALHPFKISCILDDVLCFSLAMLKISQNMEYSFVNLVIFSASPYVKQII